jgi:hypothetical protein
LDDELEKLRLKMEADNVKDKDVDAVASLLGKNINYTEYVMIDKQETGLQLNNPENHDKSAHLRGLLSQSPSMLGELQHSFLVFLFAQDP